MLELLWGTDWQAGRSRILEKLCVDQGREQIWIVPEQASFAAEKLLCQQGGSGVSRYAQVLSFTRLANRVFSQCGGIARQTMDQGGRILAMAQALEQVRSRLKLYAAGSRRPAFLPELLQAVDEFKSYGVSPDQLRQAAEDSGGQLAVKLEELALLLESYDAVCAGAQQDPQDRLTYLCQVLEDSDFARDRVFYIDGFGDFTGVELRIIGQLLSSGAEVTVYLCCDGLMQGLPVFETARKTAGALMQAAERAGQRVFTHRIAPLRSDEITYAAQSLFGAGAEAWAGEARQIHLRRCTDPFDQAQVVAATILQLIRQGYAYRDIAVAAADYPGSRTILDTVLRQYEIPIYFAGTEPVLRSPVFEMVITALEAATGGMEREAVLWWLKSACSGVDQVEADLLENYAITWNVAGSRWETPWTAHPDGYDAAWREADVQRLEQLNAARQRAIEPLLRLRHALRQEKTVGPMVQALYRFLQDIHLPEQLQQQAQVQFAAGQLQQAQHSAQLYEILITALEQMHALLEQVPITAEGFGQLLQVLLTQYHAGTIPASLDSVICGSIADLRGHTQQVLLLTGCQEGVLPAYRSETGLLTESERSQLLRCGITLAPDAWGVLSRDLAALHSVMQGTEAHMLWIAPTEDPSYLFLRLEQLFAHRRAEYESEQWPAELSSLTTLAAAAVRQEPETLAPRAACSLQDADLTARMQQLQRQAAYDAGGLERQTVTGLYGERIFLSASQIQTFAACRQAHFLQYGIKAKKRAQAAFDAPIYGTFVHEVLEKTVRQVQEEGGFAATSSERVEEIARTHIDTFTVEHCSHPEQQTPRFIYLYERNFAEILQVIRELEEELRSCDFIPVRFELPFRADAPMGPVEIRGALGTALISGAVDRVDLLHAPHGDFVRVVDYKTGIKDFDYTDILCGMGLQMLIYLFALEEKGEQEFGHPVKPAGVLYFPARKRILYLPDPPKPEKDAQERQKDLMRKGLLLDDTFLLQAMEPCDGQPRRLPYKTNKEKNGQEKRTGDLADTEQLRMLRGYVNELLGQFTDEIFAGNITPNPYDRGDRDTACTYCDYAPACRKKPEQVRTLKTIKAEEFWQELERKEARHG